MCDYLIEGAVWEDFTISDSVLNSPLSTEIDASDGGAYSFFIVDDSVLLSFLEELDMKES